MTEYSYRAKSAIEMECEVVGSNPPPLTTTLTLTLTLTISIKTIQVPRVLTLIVSLTLIPTLTFYTSPDPNSQPNSNITLLTLSPTRPLTLPLTPGYFGPWVATCL